MIRRGSQVRHKTPTGAERALARQSIQEHFPFIVRRNMLFTALFHRAKSRSLLFQLSAICSNNLTIDR